MFIQRLECAVDPGPQACKLTQVRVVRLQHKPLRRRCSCVHVCANAHTQNSSSKQTSEHATRATIMPHNARPLWWTSSRNTCVQSIWWSLLLVVVGCCWLLLVVVGCCWLLILPPLNTPPRCLQAYAGVRRGQKTP